LSRSASQVPDHLVCPIVTTSIPASLSFEHLKVFRISTFEFRICPAYFSAESLRGHTRITSPVWVLRRLSGKARGLRILLTTRRDGSTPKHGKLLLCESFDPPFVKEPTSNNCRGGVAGTMLLKKKMRAAIFLPTSTMLLRTHRTFFPITHNTNPRLRNA